VSQVALRAPRERSDSRGINDRRLNAPNPKASRTKGSRSRSLLVNNHYRSRSRLNCQHWRPRPIMLYVIVPTADLCTNARRVRKYPWILDLR